MNPYVIPDDGFFRTINVSGGRSSGYLLYKILYANGGLPKTAKAVFANTGKEREETLEFIHEIETRWSVPIVWLEHTRDESRRGVRGDPKNTFKTVDFKTASRNGEPFETLIESRKFLPNIISRICTSELKVSTIDRYLVRELGLSLKSTRRVLGIRHDEPRRWQKAMLENCQMEYPMVRDKVSRSDVHAFWTEQPFNLGIRSERGNCDLCYLKGKQNLLETIREEPKRADWWIAQEEKVSGYRSHDRKKEVDQFSNRWSFRELREEALSQSKLDGWNEAVADCFCGD